MLFSFWACADAEGNTEVKYRAVASLYFRQLTFQRKVRIKNGCDLKGVKLFFLKKLFCKWLKDNQTIS